MNLYQEYIENSQNSQMSTQKSKKTKNPTKIDKIFQHFIKEYIWMVNKQRKRCYTSLVI